MMTESDLTQNVGLETAGGPALQHLLPDSTRCSWEIHVEQRVAKLHKRADL